MIGVEVVARPVPPRPPGELDVLRSEEIARLPELRPVFQLEGDVMHLRAGATDEIDRVMIRTAAHEGKPVLDPIRQPETQHAAVIFDELLGVVDAERQMAELERADAGDRLVLCDQGLFGEHVDPGAFRVVERDRLGDSRSRIVPRFTAHALGFEALADVAELGVRIDLE